MITYRQGLLTDSFLNRLNCNMALEDATLEEQSRLAEVVTEGLSTRLTALSGNGVGRNRPISRAGVAPSGGATDLTLPLKPVQLVIKVDAVPLVPIAKSHITKRIPNSLSRVSTSKRDNKIRKR